MNKKDFIRKVRNILVTAATGTVVTSGMVSCDDFSAEKEATRTEEWKKIHPEATVKGSYDMNTHILKADKETDTLAIKHIKEKYLFQMTQYEQMFDSIIIKQQKADAALLSAAQKGDLTKVQEALEIMGANVNAQDAKTGNTAIMIAKEKLPFEKAFLIAKYLVAEPGFSLDVKNKNGISFMEMIDAELSKGSAAWQSISRKSDMLKPDTTRTRDNTEMDKAVAQLQKAYDSLISTYGKEMKKALGYHASALIHKDDTQISKAYAKGKIVINEDGSKTKCRDNDNHRAYTIGEVMSQTGTLEIEKLNPQNIDFKTSANETRISNKNIKENIHYKEQKVIRHYKRRSYGHYLHRTLRSRNGRR